MGTDSGRIESWKAIAEYLHRDTTTAIRWSKERGLPVHRIPGEKRSGVYAFRQEIDQWMAAEGMRKAHGSGDSADGGPAMSVPPFGVPLDTEGPVPADAPPPVGRTPYRPPVALLALIGIIGLFGVAGRALSARRPAATLTLRAEGASLEALRDGRVQWIHTFPAPFPVPGNDAPRVLGYDLANRSWVGDLNGDGDQEVLFIAEQPTDGGLEDTLHCFDKNGAELWSFRLGDSFRFGARSFGPPWYAGRLSVYGDGKAKRIAFSLGHIWWPAPLLTLDAEGRRLSTFVSSGHIYSLRTTFLGGHPMILAGGVSNSRRAASLIVLDGDRPSGSTNEASGSPYECLSCPHGSPLRSFFFPRTDLAAAARRPYNSLIDIRTPGTEISVEVLELANYEEGRAARASTYFVFDTSFRLTDARWNDAFSAQHDVFQEDGALKHSADACPDRVPRVRTWDPKGGIVDLPLRQ